MKSRWFLALVAIVGLALFSSLSVPVAAATPTVKLVLGGTGATPWAIGNIAPGNSGTNTVTLSNTGSQDGVVTIWISDIVNSEGANPESETGDTAEPGELGDYLILNVSGTNLSANFTLPAKINDFPQSAADTKHIYVNPLKAFSTLNLQWEWRLPPETGNDVQGDRLSFTINYALEEFPPSPSTPPPGQGGGGGGGAPPLSTVVTNFFDTVGSFTVDSNAGSMQTTVTTTSADGKLTVTLPAGTRVLDNNGNPLTTLTININTSPPAPPATANIIGPAYSLGPDGATFVPPITITLSYDSSTLPAGVAEQDLVIAYYDAAAGKWVEVPGTVNMTNHTITAQVSHITTFAIIGKVKPTPSPTTTPAPALTPTPAPSPPLPPSPVPPQAAPANFEVRNLTVSPAQVKPGESITISCDVINTGGQSGEFTLDISIPGLLQTSRLIRLEAGQTQAVNLTLPSSNPGTYLVDIGGVKGTFTIGTLPPVVPAPWGTQKGMSVWLIPAILAVIGAAALVYYIVFIMVRRRKYHKPGHAPVGAMNDLAQTAAQRTLYAARHQKRVAELASAIAREMHLSKELVKKLLMVGTIHDPGSVELPYPVAQTALQYHDRLNGSGYPQRLAGDEILLEARILAVADTAETMSSPRPSRPAIGLAKALEEIKRNSSALYDSKVVQAFVRLVDRGNFRFQTLYD